MRACLRPKIALARAPAIGCSVTHGLRLRLNQNKAVDDVTPSMSALNPAKEEEGREAAACFRCHVWPCKQREGGWLWGG